ncbi:hypothetical protein SNK04_013751 [Fusarium graminearum]
MGMADQAAVERTAEALFIEAVAAAFAARASGMDYAVTAAEARRAANVFHSTGPNAGRHVVPRNETPVPRVGSPACRQLRHNWHTGEFRGHESGRAPVCGPPLLRNDDQVWRSREIHEGRRGDSLFVEKADTIHYQTQAPLAVRCQLDAYVKQDGTVRTVGLSGQQVAVVVLAIAGWFKLHTKVKPIIPASIGMTLAILGYVLVVNLY